MPKHTPSPATSDSGISSIAAGPGASAGSQPSGTTGTAGAEKTAGEASSDAGDPFPQGGGPAPGSGGELGATVAGQAADTKGSAGDAAGPASLGNRDTGTAGAQPTPPAAPVVKPDATVAIVPAVPPQVELLPNGMPKHIQGEVKDERYWVYKRTGAKFWRTDRPNDAKPVLMRNASHTWDGTEAEFKDQFERD